MLSKWKIYKVAFGNKEYNLQIENGSLGFIETLYKQ